MYVLIHVTIRSGDEPVSSIRADLAACFMSVAATEVSEGCILAQPNTVHDTEVLLSQLISVEQAYDPQVDMAMVFVNNGSRWIVTEPVPNVALASLIAGRAPEVL